MEDDECDQRRPICIAHVTALVVWIIVVFYVYYIDPKFVHLIVGVIFGIPLFLFWYNPAPANDIYSLARTGMLSIGIVIAVSLLNNLSDNYTGNHSLMATLVCASLFCVLLTATDFYFGPKWISLTYHLRIIVQTFSVGLIGLAIGLYYVHRRSTGFTKASAPATLVPGSVTQQTEQAQPSTTTKTVS
jgi:uncharacterized membrane protein